MLPVQMHLRWLQKSGLNRLMPLELFRNLVDMAVHLHIKILLLNLHPGFLLNLNFI